MATPGFIDTPVQVTHHGRGRRVSLANRLQAAFGAFVAPDRLAATPPVSNDNTQSWSGGSASLADPLALPPDWHGGNDLLSLSFLPFDR